jgi:hypothetical protein
MTDQDIKDMFDQNWNMTMAELARMAGKTVAQVKRILMED